MQLIGYQSGKRRIDMEWSKAKSILIFLFAALNIFLLFTIIRSASHGRPGADYIKHVESLLESKNIRIECRIPSYNADSGSVVYSDDAMDMSHVVEYFLGHGAIEISDEEQVWQNDGKALKIGNNMIIFEDSSPGAVIDIEDRDAVEGELKKTLQGLGMKQNDYVPDTWHEQDGRLYIRYIKKYRGHLLFDIYADFIISPKGMEYAAIIPGEVGYTLAEGEICRHGIFWHYPRYRRIQLSPI